MKRGRRVIVRLAAALCLLSTVSVTGKANAQARDKALEEQLRAEIITLSSDDFAGRAPGTEGEAKTLRYLARRWFDLGLSSGTNLPGKDWFAPVTLVAREPDASVARFVRKGKSIPLPSGSVLMLTSGKRSLVRNAPLVFVGLATDPKLSRGELAGRVALMLDGAIETSERQNRLLAAGALAVLTVLDGDRTLDNVAARRKRSGYALASDATGGDLEGFVTRSAMELLMAGSGVSVADMETLASSPDFRPRSMELTASLEATSKETSIKTHNLIGRLPGRRPASGAVLLVAHWDHFGLCAEPPAEDVVCNGAIDNASGLAVLTEIARRLVRTPRMERDVYFLATTAEELGMLGAHAFAENPPLPIKNIVAAFNIDSVALAPAGTPLGFVGRDMTTLDAQIAVVAKREKRKITEGTAANAYVRRQDGWALLQHDIPAVMITSAYGDISRIERFFESDYHRPSDQVKPTLELGGAAQDVAFHVALTRWFADPTKVPLLNK